jgi:hypothetical protein
MLVLIAALAATLHLASAEPTSSAAPIPINGPITISQSGDYIVTQDFTAVGVPAIQFADNTTATAIIDFDGHKVVGSIHLRERLDRGSRMLTIKNGEFAGGISASTSRGMGGTVLAVDELTFTSATVDFEDASIVAKHCHFVNSSLAIRADFGGPLFHMEDSEVIGGSLNGQGSRWHFVGNDIQNASIVMLSGMNGTTTGLVAGNVVRNGGIAAFSSVGAAYDLQILGNDVSGSISLNPAIGSLVYGNVIRCGGSGTAIRVNSVFAWSNQIVRNEFLGGCDHGIYFGDGSRDNVYTDNDFEFPVPQPIVDFGENNHPGPPVDVGPD